MSERTCGGCSACCFTHQVAQKPFRKPTKVITAAFEWCQHVCAGGGCGIYERRPRACRIYSCLWLQGLLEDEMKPTKVGFVVDAVPKDIGSLVIVRCRFFEAVPGSLRTSTGKAYLKEFISKEKPGHDRFFVSAYYLNHDGTTEHEVFFPNSKIFTQEVIDQLMIY